MEHVRRAQDINVREMQCRLARLRIANCTPIVVEYDIDSIIQDSASSNAPVLLVRQAFCESLLENGCRLVDQVHVVWIIFDDCDAR